MLVQRSSTFAAICQHLSNNSSVYCVSGVVLLVNGCFTSHFGTNGHLSDISGEGRESIEPLNQCWLNVEPALKTLVQHLDIAVPTSQEGSGSARFF